MATKNKFYLVKMEDGNIQCFQTWKECEKQVHGTPLRFAAGETYEEALEKLTRFKKVSGLGAKKPKNSAKPVPNEIPTEGICSDGACSGNPGPSEYQVTDLAGNRIIHKKLGIRSNNFAEIAGIGAMVKYAIASKETNLLWTDSKIALGWILTQRIGQTVHDRSLIVKMAHIIHELLKEHPELVLKKWKTRSWGQIPADFGRKG